MNTNASFIYYRAKDLGKNLNEKNIGDILGISLWAINVGINDICYEDYFKIKDALSFTLKTTYPGLIIGSGYNHPTREIGSNDVSDFQLGFYFDHTTGIPVIPGSTVKGVLKNVFPKKDEAIEVKLEKIKYINSIVAKDNLIQENNWETLFNKEDIFFDAYISGIPSDGKIFAEDYTTPHKDIFKDPIPIRFLKIAPGVIFCFQFILNDSCFKNTQKITANEKLNLFKQILLDFGIGAKRNVGYGDLI